MLDEFKTIYLKDLLMYSGSEVEHEVYIHLVFDYLHKEILLVKYNKSKFGKDSVEYLGHIIGQGHVYMDSSKVQAITE